MLEHRLPDQLEQPGEVLVGVVYHFDLYFFFIEQQLQQPQHDAEDGQEYGSGEAAEPNAIDTSLEPG